jgi:beta-1,4-galactosyltransferase 3
MLPHSFNEISKLYPDVSAGGTWMPKKCWTNEHVAIIVPYLNREPHLRVLIYNLNRLLQLQQIHYAIYVVEPVPQQTFNRAKLFNVGFTEAMLDYAWNCSVFHDVDLIPESLLLRYTCPYANPRHLAYYYDRHRQYTDLTVGGVNSMTKQQFETVNGFSNDFWGWGGEDDDMYYRLISKIILVL